MSYVLMWYSTIWVQCVECTQYAVFICARVKKIRNDQSQSQMKLKRGSLLDFLHALGVVHLVQGASTCSTGYPLAYYLAGLGMFICHTDKTNTTNYERLHL